MRKSLTSNIEVCKKAYMEAKHFDVILDPIKTERLREIAKSNGQTLSGMLRVLIAEYVDTIDDFKQVGVIPDDLSKVTVAQFVKLFTSVMGKFAEEKKRK